MARGRGSRENSDSSLGQHACHGPERRASARLAHRRSHTDWGKPHFQPPLPPNAHSLASLPREAARSRSAARESNDHLVADEEAEAAKSRAGLPAAGRGSLQPVELMTRPRGLCKPPFSVPPPSPRPAAYSRAWRGLPHVESDAISAVVINSRETPCSCFRAPNPTFLLRSPRRSFGPCGKPHGSLPWRFNRENGSLLGSVKCISSRFPFQTQIKSALTWIGYPRLLLPLRLIIFVSPSILE